MAQCGGYDPAGGRCGLAPNHGGRCRFADVSRSAAPRCRAYNRSSLLRCWGPHLDEPFVHSGNHWYKEPGSEDITCFTKPLVKYLTRDQSALLDPETDSVRDVVEGVSKADRTQVGGDHYSRMGISPWTVIEALGMDFFQGNALKYLMRAGRKNPDPLEDLKKARHYIDKCIERAEAAGATYEEGDQSGT